MPAGGGWLLPLPSRKPVCTCILAGAQALPWPTAPPKWPCASLTPQCAQKSANALVSPCAGQASVASASAAVAFAGTTAAQVITSTAAKAQREPVPGTATTLWSTSSVAFLPRRAGLTEEQVAAQWVLCLDQADWEVRSGCVVIKSGSRHDMTARDRSELHAPVGDLVARSSLPVGAKAVVKIDCAGSFVVAPNGSEPIGRWRHQPADGGTNWPV